MADTFVKKNGGWRKAKNVYINQKGNWFDCKQVWVNQKGTWRLVFHKIFPIVDVANRDNYDLYSVAISTGNWDKVTPIEATITVSGNISSFSTGTLSAGSKVNLIIPKGASVSNIDAATSLTIINNGKIDGIISNSKNAIFQVLGEMLGTLE